MIIPIRAPLLREDDADEGAFVEVGVVKSVVVNVD
jgi:hypothetical protein